MESHEYDEGKYIPSESVNVDNSFPNRSKITKIVSQTHTVYVLRMAASISQILLGVAIIFLSVLGVIRPLWLSAVVSMLASATTILGIYFLYSIMNQKGDQNLLLRNAMQRIMEAQN